MRSVELSILRSRGRTERRFALGSRLRSVTNYGRELRPGDRGRQAEELSALAGLPGGARDVGGDDIDIRCDLVVK
jgi:hypothetical protein